MPFSCLTPLLGFLSPPLPPLSLSSPSPPLPSHSLPSLRPLSPSFARAENHKKNDDEFHPCSHVCVVSSKRMRICVRV